MFYRFYNKFYIAIYFIDINITIYLIMNYFNLVIKTYKLEKYILLIKFFLLIKYFINFYKARVI